MKIMIKIIYKISKPLLSSPEIDDVTVIRLVKESDAPSSSITVRVIVNDFAFAISM